MSFRIEFLSETTDENSICLTMRAQGKTLEEVEREAFAQAESAKRQGATGFQIRHLNAVDVVVAIADFNDEQTHAAQL
jgi:hypothetical protein